MQLTCCNKADNTTRLQEQTKNKKQNKTKTKKQIYLPVTECAQQFVLVAFHSLQ